MENFTLSITILLTGFAVVFSVLLVLIGIIKLYGTIVYNIQNKQREKKVARNADLPEVERDEDDTPYSPAAVAEAEPEVDDGELIAVISAAVYSMYSSSSVRIKSIRKAANRGSAWRNAGLSDSTRPF